MSFRDTNIGQWTLDTVQWMLSHGLEHLSTVASRWASNVLGNWWKGWLGWWWWPPYNTGLKMSNRPREREQCTGSPLESRLQDKWECQCSLGCGVGNSDRGHNHAGRSHDGRQPHLRMPGQGRLQGRRVSMGRWCRGRWSRCLRWDSRLKTCHEGMCGHLGGRR